MKRMKKKKIEVQNTRLKSKKSALTGGLSSLLEAISGGGALPKPPHPHPGTGTKHSEKRKF